MSAYAYPKALHSRRQTPPQFGDYRRYKPYLQREFDRVCVYCRTPDTVGRSPLFHVDHYRPKWLFEPLTTSYSNLFYCCAKCNVRKGRYWPHGPTASSPVIPNPCDSIMFTHMRFVGGVVEGRTPAGIFTVEKLDLNEPEVVKFRDATFRVIGLLKSRLAEIDSKLEKLRKKTRKGELTQGESARAEAALIALRIVPETDLQMWTGTLPLPPL